MILCMAVSLRLCDIYYGMSLISAIIYFGCSFFFFLEFSTHVLFFFFFFNDPAPTEIYPLPLHAALPISEFRLVTAATHSRTPAAQRMIPRSVEPPPALTQSIRISHRNHPQPSRDTARKARRRSEEHTSELQSQSNLVCRLLLEKKKKKPQ